MSKLKKFGTFSGVYTPSILTILGVIMYMRLGWVVGSAGIIGTVAIILVAHIISIATGLSISSIATDKKVGAGGVYYVLSRSLGLPIGGAIGITLFIATALSIALYLVGFAESLNVYVGLDLSVNSIRISGSIALLVLTIIALISTSVALKTQFFIFIAIVFSLVAIFFGTSDYAVGEVALFGTISDASLEEVFAIFFPAVTGFTAGIAMSGDLKNPKKAIPLGTMASIFTGLIVYLGLAFFIAYQVDKETLLTDNTVLEKIAFWSPAVVLGIWGATLSSAIGGILGGPRILQAMSMDAITPNLFSRVTKKKNEPVYALIFTVILAEIGVLIGELDIIAEIASMFYLAAYGFINLSFYLESWASSDFNPSFKVKKWIGMLGFIATIVVMFQLNPLAMIGAFIVLIIIYLWLKKKELSLGSGDIWKSVWNTLVKIGLRKMEDQQEHIRNWKPNVLMFSGGKEKRPHLIEFSQALVGKVGMVTNFDLIPKSAQQMVIPKGKQSVKDDLFKKQGIFGRRLAVDNVFEGIQTISATFGFSGVEPNVVLMGWPGKTEDPHWFTKLNKHLIALDYNVMYLDYDERFGFRDYASIDLWWRGDMDHLDLMLNVSRFILRAESWGRAEVRLMAVNESNIDTRLLGYKMRQEVKKYRMNASVKIINNSIEKRSLYDLMKIHSSDTAMVILGVPEIDPKNEAQFIEQTNELVASIGTTLLVRSSSYFEKTELTAESGDKTLIVPKVSGEVPALNTDIFSSGTEELIRLDTLFLKGNDQMQQQLFGILFQPHYNWLKLIKEMASEIADLLQGESVSYISYHEVAQSIIQKIVVFKKSITTEVAPLPEAFFKDISLWLGERKQGVKGAPTEIRLEKVDATKVLSLSVKWKKYLNEIMVRQSVSHYKNWMRFGAESFVFFEKTTDVMLDLLLSNIYKLDSVSREENTAVIIKEWEELSNFSEEQINKIKENLSFSFYFDDRLYFNKWIDALNNKKLKSFLEEDKRTPSEAEEIYADIRSYGELWAGNIQFVENHVTARLLLGEVLLKTDRAAKEVRAYIKLHFIRPFKQVLKKYIERIELIERGEGKVDFSDIDKEVNFTIDQLIHNLHGKEQHILGAIHDDMKLLSIEGYNQYSYRQKDVSTTTIRLREIVSYILNSRFIYPVEKTLHDLVNRIQGDYVGLKNNITMLEYAFDQKEHDQQQQQVLIKRTKNKMEDVSHTVGLLSEHLSKELYSYQDQVRKDLSLMNVIQHADQYVNSSRKEQWTGTLQKKIGATKQFLKGKYQGVSKYLVDQKYLYERASFETTYAALSTKRKGLYAFINTYSISKEKRKELPFYYAQLFSGKHLFNKELLNRTAEVEQIQRASNVNGGKSGAYLVLGHSFSGKTFFSQFIGNTIFKGKTVVVPAINGGSNSIQQFIHQFKSSLEIENDIYAVLRSTEPTQFVIEDISMWWSRNDEKHEVINYIFQLIADFSEKHCFIVTASIVGYSALKKVVSIEEGFVSKVVLPPMHPEEIGKEILRRHHAGGVDVFIDGVQLRDVGKKELQLLFEKFYEISGGNIGFALRLWLSSIKGVDREKIEIVSPDVHSFDCSELDSYRFVIYQFLFHGSLSKYRIHQLFGKGQMEEVNKQIKELLQMGVLKQESSFNGYVISPTLILFIEKWAYNDAQLNT